MTAEAAEAREVTETGTEAPRHHGAVIIEWPAMREGRMMAGYMCSIFDAETGKQVTTVEKVSIPAVTADAESPITCWLTMFADGEGMPVLFPEPAPGHPLGTKVHLDEDGSVRTGMFPFLVAEMRVRQRETRHG